MVGGMVQIVKEKPCIEGEVAFKKHVSGVHSLEKTRMPLNRLPVEAVVSACTSRGT